MDCVSRSSVIWRADFASIFIAIQRMRWRISPQGAEKTTQVIQDTTQATQGTTQVRLTEEDKTVLAEIKQFPRKPLQGLGFPVLDSIYLIDCIPL